MVLEAYAAGNTSWNIDLNGKIKALIRPLAKGLGNSRATLEEVKARKHLADIMVAELFELVDIIIMDLEALGENIFYEVPGSKEKIYFQYHELKVGDVALYQRGDDQRQSFSLQDISKLWESDCQIYEEAAALFIAQFPAICDSLDKDQRERLKIIEEAFKANTGTK